jgi:glyoxylase-like metal-dependent hydrolase (beta-lactamase superfamily II)
MILERLVLGAYENNCYVLRAEASLTNCLVIDTGLSPEPLLQFLATRHLTPAALILTHGHGDHIAGAWPLRRLYQDMKIAIHRADIPMLSSPHENLAATVGEDITSPLPDVSFDGDCEVEFAGIRLKVIHTPGHTPGCICLYSEAAGALFSGDTLFAGGIGRTDFHYSSPQDQKILVENIRKKLLVLPPETKVYPGHGPATSIRNEAKYNPYLLTS